MTVRVVGNVFLDREGVLRLADAGIRWSAPARADDGHTGKVICALLEGVELVLYAQTAVDAEGDRVLILQGYVAPKEK